MKHGEITEEGDQGPGLFRVPTPKPSPRFIGPDAPQNRPRCQEDHADLERPVKKFILSVMFLPGVKYELKEVHVGQPPRQGKSTVT